MHGQVRVLCSSQSRPLTLGRCCSAWPASSSRPGPARRQLLQQQPLQQPPQQPLQQPQQQLPQLSPEQLPQRLLQQSAPG